MKRTPGMFCQVRVCCQSHQHNHYWQKNFVSKAYQTCNRAQLAVNHIFVIHEVLNGCFIEKVFIDIHPELRRICSLIQQGWFKLINLFLEKIKYIAICLHGYTEQH